VIYQDNDVFATSPGSLLDPSADSAREPPQHYLDRGWTWPLRVASESGSRCLAVLIGA
jgi:hypothetical protein